jgi:hypothetical protein
MTALDIYESVNLINPLSQRKFLENLNSTLIEIKSSYETQHKELIEISSINDTVDIETLYKDCIIDNILFLATRNNEFKGEFIRKARDVSLNVWNKKAKGIKLKKRGW